MTSVLIGTETRGFAFTEKGHVGTHRRQLSASQERSLRREAPCQHLTGSQPAERLFKLHDLQHHVIRVPTWLIHNALKQNLYCLIKIKQNVNVEEQPLVSAMSLTTTERWVDNTSWGAGLSQGRGDSRLRKVLVREDSVTGVENWTEQPRCDTESRLESQGIYVPLAAHWQELCTHS